MGVIEDVRKVIQDTVAPDLKALAVRVEELERRMELRFQGIESRIDGVEKHIDVQLASLEKRIDVQLASLEKRFDEQRDFMEKRFDALERMLNQQQVINNLVERIRFLESSVKASPAAHEEAKIERVG